MKPDFGKRLATFHPNHLGSYDIGTNVVFSEELAQNYLEMAKPDNKKLVRAKVGLKIYQRGIHLGNKSHVLSSVPMQKYSFTSEIEAIFCFMEYPKIVTLGVVKQRQRRALIFIEFVNETQANDVRRILKNQMPPRALNDFPENAFPESQPEMEVHVPRQSEFLTPLDNIHRSTALPTDEEIMIKQRNNENAHVMTVPTGNPSTNWSGTRPGYLASVSSKGSLPRHPLVIPEDRHILQTESTDHLDYQQFQTLDLSPRQVRHTRILNHHPLNHSAQSNNYPSTSHHNHRQRPHSPNASISSFHSKKTNSNITIVREYSNASEVSRHPMQGNWVEDVQYTMYLPNYGNVATESGSIYMYTARQLGPEEVRRYSMCSSGSTSTPVGHVYDDVTRPMNGSRKHENHYSATETVTVDMQDDYDSYGQFGNSRSLNTRQNNSNFHYGRGDPTTETDDYLY